MMCMKNFTIRSNTFNRLTHTGVQSKIYDVALNMVGERLLQREISERYIKNTMSRIRVFHIQKSQEEGCRLKRAKKGHRAEKKDKMEKNGDRSVNQSAGGPAITWFGLFCSLKNSLLDLLRNVWTAKKICLLRVYFSGRCGFSPHSRI